MTIRAAALKHARTRGPARQARVDLPMLVQELHALLGAGLNLPEALESLAERESGGATRQLLEGLLADLRRGMRLSDAAQRAAAVFPSLLVGMLRAAEHTGDLPHALKRFMEWRAGVDQLRARLVSAAIYPAILMAAGLAVTLFLMLQVVPSFAEVYRDGGRPMPWASGLLMNTGLALRQHLLAVLLVLGVSAALGVRWLRRLGARSGWLGLLEQVPGLRHQVRRIELARLYLTLGTLLEGGIPITPALALARHAAGVSTEKRLRQVQPALDAGLPLSRALELAGLALPVSIRLLRAGEHGGQLGTMLLRAARFHDDENLRFVERFTKAFEPALMAFIGLVIAAIVVLLYLPIFDLVGSLA